MDNITQAVSAFIKDKGIQVSTISRKTGISRDILHNSFSGKRKLRADEYLAVCDFLEKDPKDFKTANVGADTGQHNAA